MSHNPSTYPTCIALGGVAITENFVSNVVYELHKTSKQCYREKLDKAFLIDDPYVMDELGIHSMDWPRVEYPNSCNFLIQLPSLCTSESLNTYKRLYGYNFCVNGFLFTLENNFLHQNMTTGTSLPCSWLPPSYQALTYSEV